MKQIHNFYKGKSWIDDMVFNSPQWFNIVSTFYHLISFLVAGAITLLGYKAYKLMKSKKYLNFALAFFFITLSFIVLAITNILVYFNLGTEIFRIFSIINIGFIIYALLTIAGFFLLVMLTFKVKDVKIIAILAVGMIAALALLPFIKTFHTILLALTLLLSYCFYENCKRKKTVNSKLVFSAFILMMTSHIFSLASGANELIFIIGNTVLVIGYTLLLITILRFK